jgi:hypothetical protein
MIGIGIGVDWLKASFNIVSNTLISFKSRVTSYGNSMFEASSCLYTYLTKLDSKNLLNKVSLLTTPNAYKESILYSAIPNTTLGDMTVVRATTATRVNSEGFIEETPYNLAKYSQDFLTTWILTFSTVITNTQISPNGTLTADTLTSNGLSAFHSIQASLSVNSNTTYTTSIFAKKGTNNFMQIVGNSGIYTSGLVFANFDLNNGVVGSVGTGTTSSIIDFGNGWYRCTMTATATATATDRAIVISIVSSSTSSRAEVNTLDTSVYIWGAQLVTGSTPKDYFPTTDRLNVPRLNYDAAGGCPSILSEPQRTNLLLNSTIVTNQIIITTAVANTISFYGTGTINLTGTFIGSLVGTGINNRVSLTFTPTIGNLILTVTGSCTNGQLEVGAYPTSYIPTVASTVTRNSDVISRNNIYTNGLITSAGGTWFVELNNNIAYIRDSAGSGMLLMDSTETIFGFRIKTAGGSGNRVLISKVEASVETILYTTLTNIVNIVIKWNGTTADVFVNGVKVILATVFTGTLMSKINTNLSVPLYIKSSMLFPTPLLDTECIALTTL